MAARRLLICCALLLGAATGADAQTLSGSIVGRGSGEPVGTALVVLYDASGRQAGSTMSNQAGLFTLKVPSPGRYTLQIERVGYVTTTSDTLHLTDGANTVRVPIAEEPVHLPAIEARAGPRECGRSAQGSAVFTLWSEIRKALRLSQEAVSFTQRQFSMLSYARDTDLSRSGVVREQRDFKKGSARLPYSAVPLSFLREHGFAQQDGEDWVLLGPDEGVLLSDDFVDRHCFRVRRGPTADLVGLAFEPVRNQKLVDIAGVLWVDRTTAHLRYLEYQYVNLPQPYAQFGAKGEMHFRQINDGTWAVVKWWIRSPRIEVRAGRTSDARMIGHHEDGGVVLAAGSYGGAVQLIEGGAVVGVVHDSITGKPLSGGTVFLAGTEHSTQSAADGTFAIVGVPPGEYDVAYVHPELATLGVPVPMQRVRITERMKATTLLATPALPTIMRAACPADPPGEEHALIYGDATPGQLVRATWQRGNMDLWRETTTSANGRYVLCWIPADVPVTVRTPGEAVPAKPAVWLQRVDFRR